MLVLLLMMTSYTASRASIRCHYTAPSTAIRPKSLHLLVDYNKASRTSSNGTKLGWIPIAFHKGENLKNDPPASGICCSRRHSVPQKRCDITTKHVNKELKLTRPLCSTASEIHFVILQIAA